MIADQWLPKDCGWSLMGKGEGGRHQKTFEGDGYVHCLYCGDEFKGVMC